MRPLDYEKSVLTSRPEKYANSCESGNGISRNTSLVSFFSFLLPLLSSLFPSSSFSLLPIPSFLLSTVNLPLLPITSPFLTLQLFFFYEHLSFLLALAFFFFLSVYPLFLFPSFYPYFLSCLPLLFLHFLFLPRPSFLFKSSSHSLPRVPILLISSTFSFPLLPISLFLFCLHFFSSPIAHSLCSLPLSFFHYLSLPFPFITTPSF